MTFSSQKIGLGDAPPPNSQYLAAHTETQTYMNLDIRTRARLPSVVPSLGCSLVEKPMQIRRSDLHAVVLLYLSAARCAHMDTQIG